MCVCVCVCVGSGGVVEASLPHCNNDPIASFDIAFSDYPVASSAPVPSPSLSLSPPSPPPPSFLDLAARARAYADGASKRCSAADCQSPG